MVKEWPAQQTAHMQPVYLTKGQERTCDIRHGLAKVKQPVKDLAAKRTVSTGSRAGFAVTFDQQPLPEVLESIAKGYDVPIRYNKEALDDMVSLVASGKQIP